ncbi:hypothetical protein RJ55_05577 [Drechmeria coniospora]|nr:hypothetical protein RJ55_05577 [Drechmeria coniospora]
MCQRADDEAGDAEKATHASPATTTRLATQGCHGPRRSSAADNARLAGFRSDAKRKMSLAWVRRLLVVASPLVGFVLVVGVCLLASYRGEGAGGWRNRGMLLRERQWDGGARAVRAAGNSTLGFGSIRYINLRSRYDRLDAASIQAFLTGLRLTESRAVEPDMIRDVGMPPMHNPGYLKPGQKGCWRAHANIWASMLQGNAAPVLVIESDTTWDLHVRSIMSEVNRHFTKLLRDIESTALPQPAWGAPSERSPCRPTREDPWCSGHWDILSIGQCMEGGKDRDVSVFYHDPHVPPGKDYWGRTLGRERVVRRSGGFACTTAYAISQTGAAKMLLRSAVDLNAPVDLLMRELVTSGDLVAYSVMPPVVAQWRYADNIGMGLRGANSDINQDKKEEEDEGSGWAAVKESGSVWGTWPQDVDVAFEEMALERAWDLIFPGNDSLSVLYDGK